MLVKQARAYLSMPHPNERWCSRTHVRPSSTRNCWQIWDFVLIFILWIYNHSCWYVPGTHVHREIQLLYRKQSKNIAHLVHQILETWYHQPSSSPRNRCVVFPETTTTPHEDILFNIIYPPLPHFDYSFAFRVMVNGFCLCALGVVFLMCVVDDFFHFGLLLIFFLPILVSFSGVYFFFTWWPTPTDLTHPPSFQGFTLMRIALRRNTGGWVVLVGHLSKIPPTKLTSFRWPR